MEKVIRDGKVAVLRTDDYGSGWFSEHGHQVLLFHPKLVELVEQGRHSGITLELCKELLGKDEYIYCGGVSTLVVEWLPEGTKFHVNEYDGLESIITTFNHITA
jgi:hypothetical protein